MIEKLRNNSFNPDAEIQSESNRLGMASSNSVSEKQYAKMRPPESERNFSKRPPPMDFMPFQPP
jgi:hypothetical protein